MTMTTFTSGVNTSFSTQLNGNFTEVTKQIENSAITLQITAYESASNFCWLSKLIRVRVNGTDLERTTDGGDNWSVVESSITGGGKFYVNPNDANYVVYYTSAYNGTFVYSTNGGVDFTVGTKPTDADRNFIAYSITDTGRIYAIYDDGGNTEVAYTDNGGTNWTVVTDPGTCPAMAASDEVDIASPKNICIVYSFSDASAGDAFVGYSLDTGSSWTEEVDGTSAGNYGIVYALYIDSTHYLIDCVTDADGAGLRAIVWESTDMSNATTVYSLDDSGGIARSVIDFNSSRFIGSVFNTNQTSVGLKNHYSFMFIADDDYPIAIPAISQGLLGSHLVNTTSEPTLIIYQGLGLDGNPLLLADTDTIGASTSYKQHNVRNYFVTIGNYQ